MEGEESSAIPFAGVQDCVFSTLLSFDAAYRATYQHAEMLAPLLSAAGAALRSGRICYLGYQQNLSMLGVVDASECPPTFGVQISFSSEVY